VVWGRRAREVLCKDDAARVNDADNVARRFEHRLNVEDCSIRVIGGSAADLCQ
jgi:hypothetical protein